MTVVIVTCLRNLESFMDYSDVRYTVILFFNILKNDTSTFNSKAKQFSPSSKQVTIFSDYLTRENLDQKETVIFQAAGICVFINRNNTTILIWLSHQ